MMVSVSEIKERVRIGKKIIESLPPFVPPWQAKLPATWSHLWSRRMTEHED